MSKIYIIGAGLGNIKSVQNIIKKVGGVSQIIKNPSDLPDDGKFILPGVGHFDYGIECLNNYNWIPILNDLVLLKKRPILGICLGMQLMCSSSEEGEKKGLGWIDAEVKKIKINNTNLKIPHMGWNNIKIKKSCPIFDANFEEEKRFYFVHSYYAVCNNVDDIVCVVDYSFEMTVGFQNENIFGVQFHPEKSHKYGMNLFKNFLDI